MCPKTVPSQGLLQSQDQLGELPISYLGLATPPLQGCKTMYLVKKHKKTVSTRVKNDPALGLGPTVEKILI